MSSVTPKTSWLRRAPWPSLAPWLALGLVLRGLRVVARWDELTLAYAAYTEPVTTALAHGQLLRAATTWVGLHPPLYALLQAAWELILPVPLLWLGTSALLSLLAVVLVGFRGGPVAAAILATSPLQLADAAELNNYPLASFTLALTLALSGGPWWALALAATAATWTHVLAGAGAGAVVAWRLLQPGSRVDKLRLAAGCVLGVAPVVAGGLRRMTQAGTFDQPTAQLGGWLSLTAGAVGFEGLLLAPLLAAALLSLLCSGWRRPAAGAATGAAEATAAGAAAAWSWLAVAAVLGLALLVGAAAPHQRPYLGLLGPAAALGLGAVLRSKSALLGSRRLRAVVVGLVLLLCALRGGRALVASLRVADEIRADQGRERALDVALAQSQEGDSLWVVVPALQADDDKSATGPLMWRFHPWLPMPMARPVAFEYSDYRYGQPRSYAGRTVHSSTELDPQAFDHVAAAVPAGATLWVVLADYAPATGLRGRLERVLRPYDITVTGVGEDRGLGQDLLFEVRGLRGGAP